MSVWILNIYFKYFLGSVNVLKSPKNTFIKKRLNII